MTNSAAYAANTPDLGYIVPTDERSGLVKRDELARQLIAMYGHSAANLARTEIDEFDKLFGELAAGHPIDLHAHQCRLPCRHAQQYCCPRG